MPAIAILLAIGGSFVSYASEKTTNALVPGYIDIIGSHCIHYTTCSNIVGPVICTAIYQGIVYQAYGRFPNDTVCDLILWRQ